MWSVLQPPKFRAQLSQKKLDAMLHGDQSGTVVDCFFVCGAQMYGVLFALGVVDTPAMVLLHA